MTTAVTQTTNIVPVQGVFGPEPNFTLQYFVGPAGTPFYAPSNPNITGASITSSTIDSTTIGATTPSTGIFTNVSTTTGTISTSPTNSNDIANKSYVDSVAQGLDVKASCVYSTTGNITLSGLATQANGDWASSLTSGDRILVKNQTSSEFNGIYVASASTWLRSTDMDVWSEVPSAFTFIESGTTLTDTGWVCTANQGGTINVTAMPWSQFSGAGGAYFAGTGLTLTSNTFSITNTAVTAASYGSATQVPTFSVNAQGQLTLAANTSIAIAASQITSGTIASSLLTGSYTGITGLGTLANLSVTNPISGSLSGNATTATSSTNLLGGAVGNVPYQTASGATTFLATGSNGQVLTLNAGVPSWATPTSGSVSSVAQTFTGGIISVSGSPITSAGTLALTVAGTSGGIPYFSSATTWATSALLAANSLMIGGGAATAPSTITTGTGVVTALGVNIGSSGAFVVNGGALGTPSSGTVTNLTGTAAINITGTASNLAGGGAASIPYQSASGTTAFLASLAGDANKVLQSNGTSAPSWVVPTAYATVTDDTTTNAVRYPLFASQTTGNLSTEYVSSTKLNYNPSTGLLTSTGFSGSGASLTSLPAGQLSGVIPNTVLGNSNLYIGTTAIALNRSSASQSLTGVSIDGSAGSATTATTATNATNIAITDNTTSVSTYYPVISSATTGNTGATVSSTKLSFVPNTGVLTATSFSGAGTGLTGTASSLTIGGTAANVTGTVAVANGGTGLTTTPANGALDIGNGTGFTRTTLTAGTGVTITNASGSITIAASGGSGSVTSVAQTFTGGIISVAGSPITTSGTLALTVAGTSGGIPYFSSATGWASSAALAANAIVVGGGAGVAPSTVTTGTGVITALGVNTGSTGAFAVLGSAASFTTLTATGGVTGGTF